jgi:hypothetical protein
MNNQGQAGYGYYCVCQHGYWDICNTRLAMRRVDVKLSSEVFGAVCYWSGDAHIGLCIFIFIFIFDTFGLCIHGC